MSRDSVLGTFAVAAALCVVCSLVISLAAVGFKTQQEANKLLDKKKNVLLAAKLCDTGATAESIEAIFAEKIEEVDLDLEHAHPVEGDEAASGKEKLVPVEPADALMGVRERPSVLTIYKIFDSQGGPVVGYIFPVEGKGLWSTLKGFLAIDADGSTVRGITFYEHKETPGLGGEVDNPKWKASWKGKQVYDDAGEVALDVVKGLASTEYQIDGLSGATITSKGVDHIVDYWLGQNGFGPYLKSQTGGAGQANHNEPAEGTLISASAR